MGTSDPLGEHAVVLGASVAGLLAARVLARSYPRVTVVDRDVLPPIGQHRRGVPQSRHLHVLHARGAQVLEELFPDLLPRMTAHGAVRGDVTGQGRWQFAGHRFRQETSGIAGVLTSRPFLEGHLRAALGELPGVSFVPEHDVVGLCTSDDRQQVTGVRLAPHGVAAASVVELPADLVVDATGRGSRTPRWLHELGYPTPHEDRFEIRLGYASRTYRLRPGALGHDQGVVTGATPEVPRGGVLAAIEGDRYILTLSGILGDHPPIEPAEFEAFATTLVFPDITDALQGAQPVDAPVAIKFPAGVRHRYERLRRFPQRLLVIGDAVCSFNPVYGQGMTVAALEALALRELLAGGVPQPRPYFRSIARLVDVAWDLAVGGDLAFPQVPGRRPAKVRLVNAYLARLQAAAASDASLATAFVRVVVMLDRPESLLRPDRVIRVLRAARHADASERDRPIARTPHG